MEMLNLYCWGAIGAVFCLVVGAMWGYCRQEAQQVHANALQRDHLQAVDAKWRELLEDAKNQAAVHENNWKFADKYRAAIVELMTVDFLWDFSKHGDDPMKMLHMLCASAATQALDPAISQKAKNLHTRGVRKGAAKGREQMRKFLMKSIDNQADTINKLYSMYDDSVAARNRLQQDFDDLLIRKNTMQQAFNNVLADKLRILSIRKAFKVAVLNETGRLRSVHKQGA
jgi:hypothetical protein